MTAKYFDAIHARLRNARSDADLVARTIRERVPDAVTLLDVACGTGEHALQLASRQGFAVEGLDIDAEAIAIARAKLEGARLQDARFMVADMRSFATGRRYDAIISLCSSLGYALTHDGLVATFRCMAGHLAPGGLVLIEPWFRPDNWTPGRPRMVTVDRDDLKICRISSSRRSENRSHLTFDYLIGSGTTTEHIVEHHELALFTIEETLEAFSQAGLQAEHHVQGIFERGAYMAWR